MSNSPRGNRNNFLGNPPRPAEEKVRHHTVDDLNNMQKNIDDLKNTLYRMHNFGKNPAVLDAYEIVQKLSGALDNVLHPPEPGSSPTNR
jgi:hypothetical protein